MYQAAKKTHLKALSVSPQPFFSPRGTPISVYHRTQVLAEQGVEIDLLTYGEGQDVVIPGVRIVRIPRFAFLGEVQVGPSVLKCFLDIIVFFWMVGLLIRHRYDFVHVHEEAVFLALFLKPIFRFYLIYDMHSSLPQQLINFDFANNRPVVGLFRFLERLSLRHSDAIITVCPHLLTYIRSQVGDRPSHFLIENSITDPIALAPPKNSTAEKRCGAGQGGEGARPEFPADSPVVVYAGTLEAYQGIDLLLGSFAKVKEALPETRLLIVGGTPSQMERYETLGKSLRLDGACIFTGTVPQELARSYCRKAQVQVAPRLSGAYTPLKVYEQLANGTPIVATNVCSHVHVLNDDVAILVSPNSESLAQGLISALTEPEISRSRAQRAQQLYKSNYSRDVYVKKTQKLLDRMSLDVRDRRRRQLR
jgi:glycosyltransferase involved in cell wall biosynthesis